VFSFNTISQTLCKGSLDNIGTVCHIYYLTIEVVDVLIFQPDGQKRHDLGPLSHRFYVLFY